MRTGFAIAAGWVIDRALGEPPTAWHPVARFGQAMGCLERRTYRPTKPAGIAHALAGISLAAGTALVARRCLGRHLALSAAVAGSVAGRMLAAEGGAVLGLVEQGDLAGARSRVRSLVGRDTAELTAPDIVRAVIESVAENTVDAVVAPLWWAAVAGSPGVLVHRAVNTLDAMVGHRSARYVNFGWASARTDDLLNYIPARTTAATFAILRPRRAGSIWCAVRRDAPAHPSPNGGVVEAAMAAALGVRLGGANAYAGRIEERGELGLGAPPTVADARRAIRLTSAAGALVAGVVAILR